VPSETVCLGSAGSIAATATFAETYGGPRRGSGEALSTEDIVFDTPDGELPMTLVKAEGVGLVNFAIIPHVDNAEDAAQPPEYRAIREFDLTNKS
jgi:dipeptidase E